MHNSSARGSTGRTEKVTARRRAPRRYWARGFYPATGAPHTDPESGRSEHPSRLPWLCSWTRRKPRHGCLSFSNLKTLRWTALGRFMPPRPLTVCCSLGWLEELVLHFPVHPANFWGPQRCPHRSPESRVDVVVPDTGRERGSEQKIRQARE
ncbi:hypothetical protein NDU88_002730 [Pleurodeles waltl]|uniref:Uncharacterized protein n=1 Tax=Pleurodeles waltl TaxID=8319 RepID=A0AAV7MPQ9_PLEWA|nr:hypothetical protein NDU88_002730 [Pleurodeles waltl]